MKKLVLTINDFKHIKRYIKKYNYDKDIVLRIDKEDLNDSKELYWLDFIVSAINIKDKDQKYEYIYNRMCDYLDKNICILCDFKNDKCLANRCNKSVHNINGCCYFKGLGFCEFFKNKRCSKKSLSCKLFMCNYVEKKYKFKSNMDYYPPLRLFFNRKEKDFLSRQYKKNYDEIKEELLNL